MIITKTNNLSNKEYVTLQKILFKQGYDWWTSSQITGIKHKLKDKDENLYYIKLNNKYMLTGTKDYLDSYKQQLIDDYQYIDAKTYIRKYKLNDNN